jgi:quinol monooxygenase YgiN
MEGKSIMSETFTDQELLEFFKNVQEMFKAQKQLNEATMKRLEILENYNFKIPLKLTKEMEVKN